ncbi:MAG: hypothetical protein JO260_06175 [Acidobacteria bacterium]|nr:hypothetical protein [Acidobacteriota bacterium]
MSCAGALIATVSPVRAHVSAEDEPRLQSTSAVTALNALDSIDTWASIEDTTGFREVAEKPQAPAPKIATDTEVAQQTNSSASGNSQQKPTGPPSNPTGQKDDNPKRILGFIPNFQTKNDDPGNQPPLTVKQKYILAWHQTVDFSAHIGNLFQAGLQQASDAQPHYGEGWGPYLERFGAAEGDQVTSSFFIFGFLPSILHDDPRYFRKGPGHSIKSRIYYAATRTVISRKDSGESTFNIPQVAGQLFQQSISTIYYPPEDRTSGRVFENWGTTLAYNSAYNVVKEFYPDLLHLVFHRRHHDDPVTTRPPPPPSASH